MSDQFTPETPKRGPGRPPRTEEVRQQRRRRADTGSTAGLKMYVHPDAKDPNYEYRIFNDSPGRIHSKTVMDDWDIVTIDQMHGKHDPGRQHGEGTQVQFLAGEGKDRKAMSAYLCRKPKDLYEQDKKQEQAAIRAQEEEMRRGHVASPHGPSGISRAESYIPTEGIKIEQR